MRPPCRASGFFMLPPFLVCDFAKETLSNLVKERFGDDFPDIIQKKQITYVFEYLKELDAKKIILETEYVDGNYLQDYSNYYVRCFKRYGERCARLHFFSCDLDHMETREALENNSKEFIEKIKEGYLGFMVIKPIPQTFIGKTCLRAPGGLYSLIKKKVHANFFGIPLEVYSIPFQEQDKVVSACATTAIWTVLHAQTYAGYENIPSSSEITLSAINHITNSSNSFPNTGLTNKQIGRAFDVYKLKSHLVDTSKLSSEEIIRSIKIYIDSGI